jgi:CTP:molybdopterin cytidylyltransferase MocA
VRFARNPVYETTDMLASVKAGVQALDECDAFYLLPGDMPAVGTDTLSALASALERTDAKVVFPTVRVTGSTRR